MKSAERNKFPVTSHIMTISDVVEMGWHFNVPIYQRLYVWGDGQIKALMEDIYKAYREKKSSYYLGGVIIIPGKEHYFDLVDGQQRFTSLWLIGSVLKGVLWEEFNFFNNGKENIPRLKFATREAANQYLCNIDNAAADGEEELVPIQDAVATIKRLLSSEEFKGVDMQSLAGYIYGQVELIVTAMPKETDENKLFEVSNNRGVQLEHHQILKARLLKPIADTALRGRMALLWDACSHMSGYIEKNIKETAGLQWKDLTGTPGDKEKEIGLPADILSVIGSAADPFTRNLDEILANPTQTFDRLGTDDKKMVYDSGKVRSIISFPMLLLHTLRIYGLRFTKVHIEGRDSAPVDEKKLLNLFKEHFEKRLETLSSEERSFEAVQFIRLLWEIRVKFDRHIIKWAEKERNIEIHTIKKLYLSKDSLVRKEREGSDGFALLQSMLYHSQQIITHYWLTPLLNKLLDCDDYDELYAYLRMIDNHMFSAGLTDDLRIRSWEIMSGKTPAKNADIQYFELESNLGTGYGSYVFYKVDFILWYIRDQVFAENSLKQTRKEDWENYRMTAKNSVEHVSPQHSQVHDTNVVWEQGDTQESKKLKTDDFGNLVLLTSGMNSEYSNKLFVVKRAEFVEKAKTRRLDSLKSALIYENAQWNRELSKEHKELVKKYCTNYFKQGYGEYTF